MAPFRRSLLVPLALAAACARAGVPLPEPGAAPGPVVVEPEPDPVRRPPAAEAEPAAPDDLPLPPSLAREFRGAWLTPVWGGEWPSRPGLSSERQQEELRQLLDRAVAWGLNAVVLHVRAAGDGFYPSERVPWSAYLTGVPGGAPDPWYDPLAFAIAEAHRRGLELHAWFNPFRASAPGISASPASGHVSARHPERVLGYGTQLWIDPGDPAARAAVLEDILEVVERYDVDGVHLDDYFYPYVEQRDVRVRVTRAGRTRTVTRRENVPFPDTASWRRHGEPAGFANRGDWRRSNIDAFVAALYREVKARKPWVAVGISPFGIWRPGHPDGITGLDAYSEIYADARRWLREGWLDYVSPQLYWPLAGPQQRFTRLDEWWRGENVQGRHVWPGLYTEQEGRRADGWRPGEIAGQVSALRAARAGTAEAPGHVHFRLRSLGLAGLGDALRQRSYGEGALPPAMPWLGAAAPAPPGVRALPGEGGAAATLAVEAGDTVALRWWLLQVLDGGDRWRSSVHPASDSVLSLAAVPDARVAVVTGVSRTGIESPRRAVRVPAPGPGQRPPP